MLGLPQEAAALRDRFAPFFSRPTFDRLVLLVVGAILTMGRRTVSRILWTMRPWLSGHPSSYHRVFSRRRWSLWPLARVLCAMIMELIPPEQPVLVAGDDTVLAHKGKKVYAKACHRDAVRSNTNGRFVSKWGHQWVVLAILVRFPFSSRPWALPVLVGLYRNRGLDEQENRRHRTPTDLARGLLCHLLRWHPDRLFVFLGDGGYASHELARFCRRRCRRTPHRLVLVARCDCNVNLYSLPGAKEQRRRCYKKHKLPRPQESVEKAKEHLHESVVRWYGNTSREVQWLSAAGGWYSVRAKGKESVVPIRWVYVRNRQGGREDYFYSTDALMAPQAIIETFARRWSIEVTFEEMRGLLGLETTRQRVRDSVLRMAPLLLGLFSLVSLLYAQLQRGKSLGPRSMPCYHKPEPTFSDALFAVRRLLWRELLQHIEQHASVAAIPQTFRETIITYLAEAA
jgi:DDE superfamily endonuclease